MTAVRKLDHRMTVEEFLVWDSGDDYVWELVDGYPVVRDYDPATGQAAPSSDHGAIIAAFARHIGNALAASGRRCRLEVGTGVDHGRKDRDYRVPDLTVRCGRSPRDADQPLLVIEVLSPANSASEMNRKRAFYQAIDGLAEIVEVEQDEAAAILLRRQGDQWVQSRVEGLDATLWLESIGAGIPLADLYRDILPEPGAEAGPA